MKEGIHDWVIQPEMNESCVEMKSTGEAGSDMKECQYCDFEPHGYRRTSPLLPNSDSTLGLSQSAEVKFVHR